ncbi:hypothetical protein [Actinokineospora enzanensis]|uniref:hypothetical protein n=1 Tax=Actinokineospora enzanensis TaxID=155975 RepID=UPI0003708B23|nr:hypothetical protein [Actinokineospora enzanensis]
MSTDGYLSPAESLDEDNLSVDPLEEGVEPPEHWAESDRHGMTAAEERAGEDLDHRLAAEEPDVAVPDADRPGPTSPLPDLDDRVDEPSDDVANPAPPEPESAAEREGPRAER